MEKFEHKRNIDKGNVHDDDLRVWGIQVSLICKQSIKESFLFYFFFFGSDGIFKRSSAMALTF